MALITSEICSMMENINEQWTNTSSKMSVPNTIGLVRINVGGVLFKSYAKTLQRFPNTVLSNLDIHSEHYNAIDNEFFFDRNPVIFNFILDAYRTGNVHMPRDICGPKFREELEFWDISEQLVSECCWETLYSSENTVQTIETLKQFYETSPTNIGTEKQTTLRETLWNFLHEPKSSVYAKIWCMFIWFIITLSVILTAVETVASARTGTYTEGEIATIHNAVKMLEGDKPQNTSFFKTIFMKPHPVITATDAFCFVILTTELVCVFVICPRRSDLLKCWLHMSEVVCSIAFWIYFICERNLENIEAPALITIMVICKYLTILKLVRLLRIAKSFPALKIMGLTICVSMNELNMMALMLFILTSLFGSVVYLTECTYNNTFDNVFVGMYWALITLTTVGYGSYVPSTALGQIVAGCCAICGVIMLALPIGIFASNFDNLYNHYHYVYRHIQGKRSLMMNEKESSLGQSKKDKFLNPKTDVELL